MNNFILKGSAAANLNQVHDSLLTQSFDEPFTMYGLVAESISVPEDRSWVIFKIRKALEASIKRKFKANVTDAGTLLDGTEADFEF